MRAESAAPSVSLEGLFQGRFRDVARIIRDRRSGHNGDNFESKLLFKAGFCECGQIFIAQMASLFDQRSSQFGKGGIPFIGWQSPLTDGLNVGSFPGLIRLIELDS